MIKKYKVNVYNKDSSLSFTPWFKNFMRSVSQDYSLAKFHDILSRHNAVNIPGTEYIEFATEADFLIFKLKFS